MQIWAKWISETLTIDQLSRVTVNKTRWLRKYDTSRPHVTEVQLDAAERPVGFESRQLERGCRLELVTIGIDAGNVSWWSVGFEAFGDLGNIEDSLDCVLTHLAPGVPNLAGGIATSATTETVSANI